MALARIIYSIYLTALALRVILTRAARVFLADIRPVSKFIVLKKKSRNVIKVPSLLVVAFAGFGFITYYVGAKLHAFNHRGRGESWRLFISLAPLVVAALIAVSRTCDYHHHWEDVTVGSIIGLFVSYLIYRQYYPSIFSLHCHRAYPRDVCSVIKEKPEHCIKVRSRRRLHSYKRVPSEECGEASLLCENQIDGFSAENDKRPLLSEQKTENKWF